MSWTWGEPPSTSGVETPKCWLLWPDWRTPTSQPSSPFDRAEDDEYIPPPPVLIRQNAAVVPLTPAMRPDPMVAARQPLRKRGRDNDGGEEPPLKRRLDYW